VDTLHRRHAIALLVACSLATVPATGLAWHVDDPPPVVHRDTAQHAASWGLRVDTTEPGDVALDLEATEPPEDDWTHVSTGFGLYDDGELSLLSALTLHDSPDRTRAGVGAGGAEAGYEVDRLRRGEGAASPGAEVDLVGPAAGGGGTDTCPWLCLGIETTGAEPGAHRYLLWTGGVGDVELTVHDPGEVAEVAVREGEATVLGDADLEGGDANAQVQRTACERCPVPGTSTDAALGVKVLRGAFATERVDDRLYGFWSASDVELACQFTVGACLGASSLTAACSALAPAACDPTQLSWEGPGGGGQGPGGHAFVGEPPGAYRFTVDRKVDV
jgi:hypothetical protein